MQAAVGDRLHVHANVVGHPGRTGEIVEVRGAGGEPPYLVRFDDGHTALVFPGPDAIIEHPRKKGKKGRRKLSPSALPAASRTPCPADPRARCAVMREAVSAFTCTGSRQRISPRFLPARTLVGCTEHMAL